jgi:hypothetical protein
MALNNFIPTIWSNRILSQLNDALVYRNVCTTEYEGEITAAGDVVKINEIGPINVNSYSATSTGALTVQQLTDAQKELRIDQQKYWAFWLDEADNAKTKPKVLLEAMQNGAWSMANAVDEYVAGLYGSAGVAIGGTAATGVDVTATNVMKYLSLANQKLDERNTPKSGRWVVVPPWFEQKMVTANVTLNTNNSDTLRAGYIGSTFYGFDVYVSNNVYHASGTDRAAIMFGYSGSIALATQVLVTRQEPSGTIGFKTLVKSLAVYGAKVIRPNNLGILWADYTAEAT